MARFEERILLRLVRSDGCQHVLEEMSLYSHFVAIVALPSNYHLKALIVDLVSSTIATAGGIRATHHRERRTETEDPCVRASSILGI